MASWKSTILSAHKDVADDVFHIESHGMPDRYFVWQEDGSNDLLASGKHAEKAVTGSTDLFTRYEFDSWKEAIEESFDNYGISWRYESMQYEEETGFIHHEWYWEVI